MGATNWIPVSTKPEKLTPVLVTGTTDRGKSRVTIAMYVPPKTILAEEFLSEEAFDTPGTDLQEYDEAADCYWTAEGWFEHTIVGETYYGLKHEITVTHWQPLPEGTP